MQHFSQTWFISCFDFKQSYWHNFWVTLILVLILEVKQFWEIFDGCLNLTVNLALWIKMLTIHCDSLYQQVGTSKFFFDTPCLDGLRNTEIHCTSDRSSDINVLHGIVVINTKMQSWITIASNVPSSVRRQIWSFLMKFLQWMWKFIPQWHWVMDSRMNTWFEK